MRNGSDNEGSEEDKASATPPTPTRVTATIARMMEGVAASAAPTRVSSRDLARERALFEAETMPARIGVGKCSFSEQAGGSLPTGCTGQRFHDNYRIAMPRPPCRIRGPAAVRPGAAPRAGGSSQSPAQTVPCGAKRGPRSPTSSPWRWRPLATAAPCMMRLRIRPSTSGGPLRALGGWVPAAARARVWAAGVDRLLGGATTLETVRR